MTDRKSLTADGSVTFYSDEYEEAYHSPSGALTEAEKKYAEVCRISDRDEVDILDICFGLGYNSAAAIDNFDGKRLSIVGLESYQGIIDEIVRLVDGAEYPFECNEMMKKVAATGSYANDVVNIRLVMGDARETIKSLKDSSFDCVFLDPFSPKKCPELWTEEFFSEIYRVLRKGGMVSTYSCARIVRENFAAAGFTVKEGPVVGRRSPGTVALKQEDRDRR
ncbi:methyltransferase domain-containing protein [Candidatus Woesearchaeota archaeon]|jgi:tRNA U34 5-methylaminomethyl-2-thiouridine-forming methyltransferase MnmC|nr:methyltransferase domain-containing protein [Candidatus Woesearchaeota archaeon]